MPDDEQFVPDFQSDSREYPLPLFNCCFVNTHLLLLLKHPQQKSWPQRTFIFFNNLNVSPERPRPLGQYLIIVFSEKPSSSSSDYGCEWLLPPPPSISSLISWLAWGITWAELLIIFHTFLHPRPACATVLADVVEDRAASDIHVGAYLWFCFKHTQWSWLVVMTYLCLGNSIESQTVNQPHPSVTLGQLHSHKRIQVQCQQELIGFARTVVDCSVSCLKVKLDQVWPVVVFKYFQPCGGCHEVHPQRGELECSRSSAAVVMVCTEQLYGTAADAKEIAFSV